MQPVWDNMNTVAELPFWVKALCDNKQLLALRSCFPAADLCQNTELTAIPFTAVEKHQPSKPTYLLRGFEQLVIPQQRDGSQKHASCGCCQRNYCAVMVLCSSKLKCLSPHSVRESFVEESKVILCAWIVNFFFPFLFYWPQLAVVL